MGEIAKKVHEEVEVVRACDGKRGALRRKESDGNESTGERKGLRDDGWTG